jgi:hypothetical protein
MTSRFTAFLELALLSAAYGLGAMLTFRRFIDAAPLHRTSNRILAHVLEFRLFLDEPRMVLRAQRELIGENIRLLRQIALPCALPAILFALFYGPLDRHFGHGPLRSGESVVVTAPMASGLTELQAPAGVVVETPGVRVERTREISWRVRAVSATYGRFPKGVAIRYPRSPILGLPWMVWFFGTSMLAALAAQRLAARAAGSRTIFPGTSYTSAAGCCYF